MSNFPIPRHPDLPIMRDPYSDLKSLDEQGLVVIRCPRCLSIYHDLKRKVDHLYCCYCGKLLW